MTDSYNVIQITLTVRSYDKFIAVEFIGNNFLASIFHLIERSFNTLQTQQTQIRQLLELLSIKALVLVV